MEVSEIEQLLNDALALDELHVKFDGSQCVVIAVSDEIAALSRVKRQQAVYAPLTEAINAGTIHAVTIKVFSTSDWQREKMFNLPL
ncbi:BolA family protein [Thalassotalea agarivorans]|uniref:Acid stress-induced BolA-like protein IbaG/YrbA, predicted regulator of iron metabolism n=1 Tax=Thalassotalea agarivorans TaxID=349064 RepID=A0A1I0FUC6_THASX|nr:BolA/IbaG family iron-sulfur metabolism protein [Thalassotalea agarivorans]SET61044.1 Acid stress-induced BolA-like protein IbaG/YrbA, predicted regulator of iron metabolism [Thalassotalea agarivorans]